MAPQTQELEFDKPKKMNHHKFIELDEILETKVSKEQPRVNSTLTSNKPLKMS